MSTRYTVASAAYISDLDKNVNIFLANGYELHGGLVATSTGIFLQPLVLKKEKLNQEVVLRERDVYAATVGLINNLCMSKAEKGLWVDPADIIDMIHDSVTKLADRAKKD